tara:strand:- start:1241 stop:1405 length:165 start_codon:yes stop_codon:yes gene_type:complete
MIITHSKQFTCDGLIKEGMHPSEGHPKVYLNMGDDNEMVCPYCSEKYEFRSEEK